MSAQRQKPIDFTAQGFRLALPVDRNCGIRAEKKSNTVVCLATSVMGVRPESLEEPVAEDWSELRAVSLAFYC